MYLTNLLPFLLVLMYSGTRVNGAATTFVPVTGTAFAIGSDVSIVATIDISSTHTITVTYDLTPAVSIAAIVVDHTAAAASKLTLTATVGLADRYTITKTDDDKVTVVIKAIAATDDAIVLQFNSDGGTEDGSTTINTKTGFSPASQYVAFGDDLTVVATIPVDATQTFTVTYGLTPPLTLGTVTVDHDASTEAAKLVVAAASGLAAKYSIAETTDTTVTIMIKTITNADDGIVITLNSDVNTQDVTYTVNAKTSFSPLSGTVGKLGMDFVITATMSVIASHMTSISLHDGNNKTHIAWLTVVHTPATSALKLVVDADAALDATKFSIVEASDTTVTLTFKKYATTDFNKVFVFDSTDNNQDAVFVIGGGSSFECDRIPPFGIEVEMTSSGCNQTTYQTKGCQVVFKCTDGYYGQSVVSTCNDAYQWTNGQPTCMRQCDAHPSNVNVLLSSGTGCSNTLYNLGKCESFFGCSDGSIGDKTMRTCKEDGIWTGEFPTCKN